MCYYGNMSNKVILVDKKMGQTPLDCIKQVKDNNPILAHLPITYAGRLDPLASGVLVLLVGDECMKKDEYLALSKEYEVEVLFGFSTDTYDVMGKIVKNKELNGSFSSFTEIIQKNLIQFTGRFSQSYPPYSSRAVHGKPLFQWAREGKLNEIEIPSHDVFVDSIEIIKEYKIKGNILLSNIKSNINLVSGDFRQDDIIHIWEEEMKNKEDIDFSVVKLRIICGGGVYVRGIAHSIGEKIGMPALAFSIVRTKVGKYCIDDLK